MSGSRQTVRGGLRAWSILCAGCALLFYAGFSEAYGEAPCGYYVDSEAGRDDADGRSREHAWRSLGRVNAAALKPGDTVRFKCGGVWRGSLETISGSEPAPITYTAYGQGPKPLLLGSVPRNRPQDWVQAGDNIWATLPLAYTLGAPLPTLRQGAWNRHEEGGASVTLRMEDAEGGQVFRFACGNSGTAPNHVQFWGPELPTEQGACLMLIFRARSSIPFSAPEITIRKSGPPWTRYATASLDASSPDIRPEWNTFRAVFTITDPPEAGRVHMYLGAILPAGAVFEFQPIALHAASPNIADPLSVDVGNIIFDHGKVCGWKKWSIDDLKNPYDFYYEASSQRVFLHCGENPAALHESIECALKRHVVNMSGAHDVIYDGLAVKYGAAHGFGGSNTRRLVIRNCDLAYIGGGHQFTRPDSVPVRYGNAIEFWAEAHDHLVERCRIWEVYDAALTNQSRGDNVRQENILYRDNVIWNCEYSFEYWSNPETAETRNIRFINNTCVNAGVVWAHAQRPDPNGSHLMFYTNTAATSGFEVKRNIFCNMTQWGSRYSAGWESLPEMDYNLWFSETGVMAYWFKDKLGSFAAYRETTGLDQHSVFANPEFLDAAAGDFRLSPSSPARAVCPDGGPVGAPSLWD